jgi:hypothetical protein
MKIGMKTAVKEVKWTREKKYILLITDSPTHGRDYHRFINNHNYDNYLDDKIDDELKELVFDNIYLVACKLNKETD